MKRKGVRPEECAFLVAIPLDPAAFRRALERGSGFLAGNDLRSPDDWDCYEPFARAARELLEDIASLGAYVVQEAGLPEFQQAVAAFPVVGLLAHCHYPRLTEGDVRDPAAFAALARAGSAPEWEMLRIAAKGSSTAELLEAANLLCPRTDRIDDGKAPTGPDLLLSGRLGDAGFGLTRFDRARLEELCGAAVLEPARAVELADRAWDTPAVTAALPPDTPRLLDLSLCRSFILGSAVRRQRPRVDSLAGRKLLNPDVAAMLWKLHVVELKRAAQRWRPVCYTQAAARVQEMLASRVRD